MIMEPGNSGSNSFAYFAIACRKCSKSIIMKIAYILYNNLTLLDFVGVYDPVGRLKTMNFIPGLQWDICSLTEKLNDERGFTFLPTKVNSSLESYDVLIVPGGDGHKPLMDDNNFISWLQTARPEALKTSVCTGSMLLGAAGFLKGKRATTHFEYYKPLQNFCKEVLTDRVVEDGNVITAGAVSSAIDLGLFLCNKWAGAEAAAAIRARMDYRG
jgi:transcriptional regulator GlxA family with amidase domain